ncbi:unnamed protein product [Closterium sp. Yama58-4]|nr:unnamed protein product [Closterium sp. Yama58-4]
MAASVIPGGSIGYPRWKHRLSQVAASVIPGGSIGCPRWQHRLSQVAASVVPGGSIGCPRWQHRLSQVAASVVPGGSIGCPRWQHRLSQVAASVIPGGSIGCPRWQHRLSQVAASVVPGGSIGCPRWQHRLSQVAASVVPGGSIGCPRWQHRLSQVAASVVPGGSIGCPRWQHRLSQVAASVIPGGSIGCPRWQHRLSQVAASVVPGGSIGCPRWQHRLSQVAASVVPGGSIGCPRWQHRLSQVAASVVPGGSIGYPRWQHRLSQVAASVVPGGSIGYPRWQHRLSQVAASVVPGGSIGCPRWQHRLSQVAASVVPGGSIGCPRWQHRLSQVAASVVPGGSIGCPRWQHRLSQVAASVVPGGSIGCPRWQHRLSQVAASVIPGSQVTVVGDWDPAWLALRALEFGRQSIRSPFESNVIYNFELMECIFDYAFDRLGVEGSGRVNHPVLLTEAPCTPLYTRGKTAELMFETYGVPALAFGVDGVFSYRHNTTQHHSVPDGLLVNCGHSTTHVMPPPSLALARTSPFSLPHPFSASLPVGQMIAGQPLLDATCRIPVGGWHVTDYLKRLLTLLYPQHASAITWERAEEMKCRSVYVAIDYSQELKTYQSPDAPVVSWQLPWVPPITPQGPSEEELARRAANKERAGQRLRDMAAAKRAAKRAAELEEVEGEVEGLRAVIEDVEDGAEGREAIMDESVLYPLLDVPDAELTAEELREKRRQRTMRGLALGQARMKQAAEEKRAKAAAERDEEERKRRENPEVYTAELRARFQQLQAALEQRKRRKMGGGGVVLGAAAASPSVGGGSSAAGGEESGGKGTGSEGGAAAAAAASGQAVKGATLDITPLGGPASALAGGTGVGLGGGLAGSVAGGRAERITAAHRERMKLLTAAAFESVEEEEEEEAEREAAELEKLRTRLQEVDPAFLISINAAPASAPGTAATSLSGPASSVRQPTDADYQIRLGVERIRAAEIIFEPSLIGLDRAGLGESLGAAVRRTAEELRSKLVPLYSRTKSASGALAFATAGSGIENFPPSFLFLTGGGSLLPGMRGRLEAEYRQVLPMGSGIKIVEARDVFWDAWRGAAAMAGDGRRLLRQAVSRKEYEERGPDAFRRYNFDYF